MHVLRCCRAPSMSPQVMCTFARNGANYVQQHWYYCYTCGLVDSRGCCGACVQACHADHDTVYSACSNFFCDCGSGSARCVRRRISLRLILADVIMGLHLCKAWHHGIRPVFIGSFCLVKTVLSISENRTASGCSSCAS